MAIGRKTCSLARKKLSELFMVCRYCQKISDAERKHRFFISISSPEIFHVLYSGKSVNFAGASHISEPVGLELCRSILTPTDMITGCSNLSPSTEQKMKTQILFLLR